ncbi:MAG: YdcF family protein [Acidimicrobiales bacterium]
MRNRWLAAAIPVTVPIAACVAACVAVSEVSCWAVAGGGRAGRAPADAERAVVIVLGLPGSNPVLRAMQRWRVAMGLEAWRTHRCSPVIFSGGPTVSARSEASELAELAIAAGLDPSAVVLEERSLTTAENIEHCIPLVAGAGADVVLLASHALHAARARTYWYGREGEHPELVLADAYRPLDRWWLRTPATYAELLYRVQARRGPRPPATEVGWSAFLYQPVSTVRRRLLRGR